jgi:hypothetical protein
VTHEELRDALDAWALGALPDTDVAAVEAHLATCVSCQDEAAVRAAVVAGLASQVPSYEPSAVVRTQLLAAIAPTASGPGPVSLQRPVSMSTVSRPRLSLAWLAAAASLVLAAYLGWDAIRLRNRIADLTSQLAQARALVAANEQRVAALQHAADRDASAMAILTAPDLAQINLAGQADAPDARARAFWSRSRGMVFSASALPPLPPGRIYQLWVVTADPAPLSAGLIEPDASGRADAVFATPPDIPNPVALAVTLEPAGGVPAPTGPKYLVGTV